MKSAKRPIEAFLYFVEVIMPSITFLSMFLLFVIAVIMRYFFKSPLGWSYELNCMFYLWTGMLAICTAQRGDEEHIVFTMVYDWVGPKVKKIFDIIAKLLVVSLLGMSILPSARYLVKLTSFTPVLRIPYTYVFSVYLVMLTITVTRYAIRLIDDIRIFSGKAPLLKAKSEGGPVA